MRKILFALMGIATLAMTSCLPDPGYHYSVNYSRVTTIDTTSSPIKFIADYTGEVFKGITNLKTTDELSMFNLEGAKRAEILVQFTVDDSYKSTLLMLDAREIAVRPITNKTPTEPQKPMLGFQQFPLGGTSLAPTVWVSDGYLNVLPVVPSEKSATYHFTPEKVRSDSLFFNLTATYEENSKKEYYEYIHCYDLRTLRDTANADEELRNKMSAALTAMKENDSVRIFVTGNFIEYNYNRQNKDTIRTISHATNFFKYNF